MRNAGDSNRRCRSFGFSTFQFHKDVAHRELGILPTRPPAAGQSERTRQSQLSRAVRRGPAASGHHHACDAVYTGPEFQARTSREAPATKLQTHARKWAIAVWNFSGAWMWVLGAFNS
jgi:hypothetical protein